MNSLKETKINQSNYIKHKEQLNFSAVLFFTLVSSINISIYEKILL